MARSIPCPQCGVSLNLPPQAIGKRVKCPKCSFRFVPPDEEGLPPPTDSALAKSPEFDSDSSLELTRKHSSVELPTLPSAEGPLRETFDLPLMAEAGQASGAGHAGKQTGDATALFVDDPVQPRRKRGAEARATHRRCPTCGGYVPQGMSLCGTCGLDLDSGIKIDLADDLVVDAPIRSQGVPIVVAVLGGVCVALSVALTFAAILASAQGNAGIRYFIPVAAFGIYASTQFLRQRNAKLLLIALTLGAVIDLTWLVAMPIWDANSQAKVEDRVNIEDDPDVDDIKIQSVEERLDLGKVEGGLAILGLYAALSILIISPVVQKHFHHK